MKNDVTNINRIQQVSGKFRLLLTIFMVLIPFATLMYWLLFNVLPVGFKSELPVIVEKELPSDTLLLAFLISLIPVSAALYGAFNLRKLFGLYKKAVVFSEQNVSCFRHIGYALLSWVAADFIFVTFISVVLTFDNLPGERLVVARFGFSDIGTLIIGAVILLVSWVMKEAAVLEDEQAYTV